MELGDDRSVSGGRPASDSRWMGADGGRGLEDEDLAAETHGWLSAAQRPGPVAPVPQICLFISLSLREQAGLQ